MQKTFFQVGSLVFWALHILSFLGAMFSANNQAHFNVYIGLSVFFMGSGMFMAIMVVVSMIAERFPEQSGELKPPIKTIVIKDLPN